VIQAEGLFAHAGVVNVRQDLLGITDSRIGIRADEVHDLTSNESKELSRI
jgi:hypothetical protein